MSERPERIHFGTIKEGIEPPNLIEVQLNSYVDFLQKDVPLNKRKNYGLQAVFKEVFPIQSYDEKATLDFSHYEIGEPKLTALEAQREGQWITYLIRDPRYPDKRGNPGTPIYVGQTDDFPGRVRFSCSARPLRASAPRDSRRRRARALHRLRQYRQPAARSRDCAAA